MCKCNDKNCGYSEMPQTGNTVKLFDLEGIVTKGICEKPYLSDYKVKVLWNGAAESFVVPSDVLTII
jgi:hypothetical protein